MTKALEATQERKDCWEACTKIPASDYCVGCPFRYTCENIFPYEEDRNLPDYLPCDYVLTDDGSMFIVKEG